MSLVMITPPAVHTVFRELLKDVVWISPAEEARCTVLQRFRKMAQHQTLEVFEIAKLIAPQLLSKRFDILLTAIRGVLRVE